MEAGGRTAESADAPVLLERNGAIATLRLNRPERLNAVNVELYTLLRHHVHELGSDDDVRAIIVTGQGRAFCVGADLKAHAGEVRDDGWRRRYVALAQGCNRALQRCPKPVLAAVNGHAIGAGLELAMSCDFVVVARQAKLRLPEIALGTFVGGGITRTLVRRAGQTRAVELLMLCDFFTPDDALSWGLINRVADASDVAEVTQDLAMRVAAHAPVSLRLAKRLLWSSMSVGKSMKAEASALMECMGTADWAEGVRAFEEKREPHYTGR